MIDNNLKDLARRAGLTTEWIDYRGEPRSASPDTVRAVLAAMDLPAASDADIRESSARLTASSVTTMDFLTCVAGDTIAVSGDISSAAFVLEDGERIDATIEGAVGGLTHIRTPAIIGYHQLELSTRQITIAAATPRAWTINDIVPNGHLWGVATQLYSLNDGSGVFGDLGDLAILARDLAAYGADFVTISPIHALFSADLQRFGPYGPSTRHFLNPLVAESKTAEPQISAMAGDNLIDWQQAGADKLARFRVAFARFKTEADAPTKAAFETFIRNGGEALLDHARFETLDHQFRPLGKLDWRTWPGDFRNAHSIAVKSLSSEDSEVRFHLYLQWIADLSMSRTQNSAKSAGMRIGLITDMAVGMDPGGSYAWSASDNLLAEISIGAPPDLLNEFGQDWGLTTFSPTALRRTGFQPFISTLRRVLRDAGGIRIDHAMGLQRLWLVPKGAAPTAGTYLNFPFQDLMRLVCLESHRHKAIVIGEDLGTVPEGFRDVTASAGILGMRPLWFERSSEGVFKPRDQWDNAAVALTTTHDLPTVAGWWSGRDIEWREKLFPAPDTALDSASVQQADRDRDRKELWKTLVTDGVAAGPTSYSDDTEAVVDAVLPFVAGTPCPLAIIAIEDLLGIKEQPNIPGTIDTHPNWRRRLPVGNGLDQPVTRRRLLSIARARSRA